MINCRLYSTTEKDQWDNFVTNHADANPYQRFAWGQAIEQAYGHKALYFVAERDSQISAVLPVVLFKRPFAKEKLVSLPFCDVGGLLSNDKQSEVSLLDFVTQWENTHQCGTGEIRQGGIAIDSTEQSTTQKVRMLLSLPESATELMANFKSKLRSQIRKAEKNGLTVELSTSPSSALVDDFYQVFSVNMRALGSPVHHKKWFYSLVENYGDKLVLACIYADKKIIGAGIVLKNGNKAAIPWASTDAQFNRLAPNMLLYWQLLAHCADSGICEFDFGRSTLGEGTYRFKSQWGAEPFYLHWSPLTALTVASHPTPESPKQENRLRNTIATCWSKLPLPLANMCGPMIRKYISL